MKIKIKKTMNLPQLIEWAWENDIKNEVFIADKQLINIQFDDTGDFLIYGNGNRKTVEFSIETEEEITEDTEFEKLYYTTILSRIVESSCTTIQSSLKHIAVEPIAFYILNDDLTMTLIWRDGRLIE